LKSRQSGRFSHILLLKKRRFRNLNLLSFTVSRLENNNRVEASTKVTC